MKIVLCLPYEEAATKTLLWANSEKEVDFLHNPEEATRCTVSFAASELNTYLKKFIPDCEISFSNEMSDTDFSVAIRAQKTDRSDSFTMIPAENGVIIEGAGRTGALYGAYEFLRMQGFAWLYPGEMGTVIPAWDGELHKPAEKKVFEPSMNRTRGFEFEGKAKDTTEFWYWMARNRLNMATYRPYNGDLQRKLGFWFKAGGHIFEDILEPDRRLPSGNTIWEEHPEWYGTPESGELTKDMAQGIQFCVSNDELLEFLAKEFLVKVRTDWKDADLIDVWGFDTWGKNCQCEACKKLGNGTDHILRLLSFLRDYVNEHLDREVRLVGCSYEGTNTIHPPVNEFPQNLRDAGDFLNFAPIIRCYEHEMKVHCSYNKLYHEVLEGWRGMPLMILEYYNVSKFEDLPFLFTDTMRKDFPLYYDLGIRSTTYMHVPMIEWGVRDLTQLLFAQLSWDVNTDVDAFLDTYFQQRYGIAAEEMKQAYRLIEDAARYCTSWRAWKERSVLSLLMNWNGQKPDAPLPVDDHLGDTAAEKAKVSVKQLEQAYEIAAKAKQKVMERFLQEHSFTGGIPKNPTDVAFQAQKCECAYELRVAEDMRGIVYGRDAMELIGLFVEYHNALYEGTDDSTVWNRIRELAERMEGYYAPMTYTYPDPGILCKDALTRTQLKGVYNRCMQDRMNRGLY